MSQENLLTVDWSTLPVPEDDGGASHLVGRDFPSTALTATSGQKIDIANLPGRTVLYIYPLTGVPGTPLPEGWDAIPGARGCAPQNCAFRDHHGDLVEADADHVFGLSVQDTAWQQEAAERLHLPFPLLSDCHFALTQALQLPTFVVLGQRYLRRMALVIDDAQITHVFYPVFPPDKNAADVLSWLQENPK